MANGESTKAANWDIGSRVAEASAEQKEENVESE